MAENNFNNQQQNGNQKHNGSYNNAYNGSRPPKPEITYEIKECYGILSETVNGWTKELNLISWNGTTPKFDLREWSPDHTRMRKGITFNHEEMVKIKELLQAV